MNNNEKYSIKKYDSVAGNYDATFDGKFTAKYKKRILAMCEVSADDHVLDVGCGNGSLIHAIRQKGEILAYGIDISPNMVAECQKRYDGIDFQVSSGEVLPFDDDFFDTVTICCVLHHLNNPAKFFAEAYRILKPGGTLIVGDPWLPVPIRQFVDYIVSPLYKAGDNKVFSHKRLSRLFTDHGFTITQKYERGFMQVVKATKRAF